MGSGTRPDQTSDRISERPLRGRPCENSEAVRARRMIFYKLRIMRIDDAADIRFYAALENCILHISPIHDFSHRLRVGGLSVCAEHNRQLGGESPLSSLMVAKD